MSMDYFVHPSSVVDEGAFIGNGTKIWHFCHLMPRARVGENCNIGQNVFVDNDVVVGNGVKIQNNVSLYNGVIIEEGVFLGPSMVFTNVVNPRSFVERKTEFRQTLIRKGASIGANATILCGIEIGSFSLVGAGAVVVKDVPAHAIFVGNPARQIGWISRNGDSLTFDENGEAWCAAENAQYRLKDNVVSAI